MNEKPHKPRRPTRAVLIALFTLLVGAGIGLASLSADEGAATTPITVWKSPTCGCCAKWIDHLEANGFAVTVNERRDMDPVKRSFGIQPAYQSCHTALVGGYLIEGHVPADDIRRLLAERPAVPGLAAPGMPMGSPGMEGPRKDLYAVVTLPKPGAASTVYARH